MREDGPVAVGEVSLQDAIDSSVEEREPIAGALDDLKRRRLQRSQLAEVLRAVAHFNEHDRIGRPGGKGLADSFPMAAKRLSGLRRLAQHQGWNHRPNREQAQSKTKAESHGHTPSEEPERALRGQI